MEAPHRPNPTQGRRSRSVLGTRLNSRSNNTPQHEQGLVGHLIELRSRLLRVVASVLVVFLVMVPFANDLYAMLAAPLMASMPEGTNMIATQVASPFLTPFKFTLVLAVFIGMPIILYHFWAFVAPGLYRHERRMMVPLMVGSTVLFFAGIVFAYFVVFPLIFGFFMSASPDGVAVMTDISSYLDFVLKLFFAFGLAFEIPIVTIVLVWAGVTTAADLAAKRPYVIVAAFVLGMLFTPPDMISQTLLAVPMWFLFEIGLLISRVVEKRKDEDEPAAAEEQ